MIAEHTSIYDLSDNSVSGLAVAIERHPGVTWASLRRLATACTRFLKAPVLPYADLWAAGLTVDLLRDRERQSRPDQYGVELDCRTDAWLRR
jgi:hypothetical protein